VDPPAEHKAYLHRSGRTARAGSAGDVVTVVLPEQRRDLAALMRKAGINVRPQQVTAHCEPVTKLVGEVAAYRAPAPKAPPAASTAPASRRRRRPAGRAGPRRSPVSR
jgi:superfamily II DNA/RNA helicase